MYLAWRDDKQYRKQVAIKLLLASVVDEQMKKRFRFERQTLANLEHPNIARLLDGGETERGELYLVMEYVRGGLALDRYCDERNLGIVERVRLFRSVCAAVQYAHQHLVVHRDLKPSNVLVTLDGEVKLVDFGIAKPLFPVFGIDEIAQTQTGMHAMTPEYASPEQILGKSSGTSTDIYSLGVVLHELLTGELPFIRRDKAAAEFMREICEVDPRKPSTVVLRSTSPANESLSRGEGRERLSRQLTGDLDNIVLMALRKDPDRRYSSVEHLSEDLGRFLEGMPVAARKDTLHYRVSKFVRRNTTGVIAAGLLLLAVGGGVVSTILQARRAEGERAKAMELFGEAQAQRQRAEWLAEVAQKSQREAESSAREAKAKAAEAENERTRASRRFDDVHKLATAFLFDFDARINKLAGSTAARKLLVDKAQEYLESLARDNPRELQLLLDLGASYVQIGVIQRSRHAPNLGDTAGARSNFKKALDVAQQIRRHFGDSLSVKRLEAGAYTGLGDMQSLDGDAKGSLEYYRQALALAERMAATEKSTISVRREPMRGHGRVSEVLMELGQHGEALKHLQKASSISENLTRDFPDQVAMFRDHAVSLMGLAKFHLRQQQWRDALPHLEQVHRLLSGLTEKYPENAQLERDLMVASAHTAQSWRNLSAPDNALPYATREWEIATRQHNADRKNLLSFYDTAAANVHLGNVLEDLGRGVEATAYYRKGVELSEEAMKVDATSVQAIAHANMSREALAGVLQDQEQWEAAESEHRKILALNEVAAGRTESPQLLRELAKCYAAAGDFHHDASKTLKDERHRQFAQNYYAKAVKAYEKLSDSRQGELVVRKLNALNPPAQ